MQRKWAWTSSTPPSRNYKYEPLDHHGSTQRPAQRYQRKNTLIAIMVILLAAVLFTLSLR